MDDSEKGRAHLFISGRVQGVTYRASTKRQAKMRGLNGWVKNLSDGRVEAVFEGSKEKIKEMITWCQDGPSRARVEDLEVTWEKTKGIRGFEVRY